MKELSIKKKQNSIIKMIKEDLQNDITLQSTFLNSVYFYPEKAKFLFCDLFVDYNVIFPLIENKTLILKGVEKHQGIKMIRYILNKKKHETDRNT